MTKWNEQEKDFVFKSFANGMTASQIGEQTGRTKNSVIALFNRERERRGVSALAKLPEKFSDEEIQIAVSLWNKGVAGPQIAKAIGRKNIVSLVRSNRELFPKRTIDQQGHVVNKAKSLKSDKPTPENTEIQYEYREIPTPEGALSKPFFCTEVGECSWILEDFWTEPKFDSPCCAMPVYDMKGGGLKRTYCQYHYEASLEKKDGK